MESLSEATAIRLYNSVVATDQPGRTTHLTPPIPPNSIDEDESTDSVYSSNELGYSCRICRWNRSDMDIMACPCKCEGSVGFIHMYCLRKWIQHKRDNRCEICNTPFDIPEEKVSLLDMMRTFINGRFGGAIVKNIIFSASLIPAAHIVLQQMLLCMQNINQNPNQEVSVKEMAVASFALLTSSALFYKFFEFATSRFMRVRNIWYQWWIFGNIDIDDFEIEPSEFI